MDAAGKDSTIKHVMSGVNPQGCQVFSFKQPSQEEAPFMVNYIVDDHEALLERLEKEGVRIDPKRQNESYGRFAWIRSRRQQNRTVAAAASKQIVILSPSWPVTVI